jgi:hypothetical protein
MTRHDGLLLMIIAIGLGQVVILWFIYHKVTEVLAIARKAEVDDIISKEAYDQREWEKAQGWKIG